MQTPIQMSIQGCYPIEHLKLNHHHALNSTFNKRLKNSREKHGQNSILISMQKNAKSQPKLSFYSGINRKRANCVVLNYLELNSLSIESNEDRDNILIRLWNLTNVAPLLAAVGMTLIANLEHNKNSNNFIVHKIIAKKDNGNYGYLKIQHMSTIMSFEMMDLCNTVVKIFFFTEKKLVDFLC